MEPSPPSSCSPSLTRELHLEVMTRNTHMHTDATIHRRTCDYMQHLTYQDVLIEIYVVICDAHCENVTIFSL